MPTLIIFTLLAVIIAGITKFHLMGKGHAAYILNGTQTFDVGPNSQGVKDVEDTSMRISSASTERRARQRPTRRKTCAVRSRRINSRLSKCDFYARHRTDGRGQRKG